VVGARSGCAPPARGGRHAKGDSDAETDPQARVVAVLGCGG